jgi:hypothetical protein
LLKEVVQNWDLDLTQKASSYGPYETFGVFLKKLKINPSSD